MPSISRFCRRLCRRAVHVFYRPYVLWRIAAPSQASVQGLSLLTDPQVFHPLCFHSGQILVGYLRTLPLNGRGFLDMGTGSGLVGLCAARLGARLTACDVNPRAVEVARDNARRNGISAEIIESNLFGALADRTFDLICFNVPFYPRAPRSAFEAAFFAGPDFATVRQFAADCSRFLAPGGSVIVIFSEDSGYQGIVAMFTAAGLQITFEEVTSRLFERFHLVRFQRRGDARAAPADSAAAR
jgi:release factor glutamine methyltransferase